MDETLSDPFIEVFPVAILYGEETEEGRQSLIVICNKALDYPAYEADKTVAG